MAYFAAGPITAAQLEAIVPVFKVKLTSELVNNTTTLQNDDHLFWTVASNTSYVLDLILTYTSNTTPDFKFTWSVPTGTTYIWGGTYYDLSSVLVTNGGFTEATTGAIGGTGASINGIFHFYITTASTAGTFQLQWAQNTANASNTTVHAGSIGVLRRIVAT